MIDIRKLKELVRLMVVNDLTEIDLRDAQEQVTLKRANQQAAPPTVVYAAPPGGAYPTPPAPAEHAAASTTAVSKPAASTAAEGLIEIASPMVGTFYAAASPDKPPFATVGMSVGPETLVCLIEAMKVFNEIKAECSGTIERVLVKNGDPVEFGQALYLVRPS